MKDRGWPSDAPRATRSREKLPFLFSFFFVARARIDYTRGVISQFRVTFVSFTSRRPYERALSRIILRIGDARILYLYYITDIFIA